MYLALACIYETDVRMRTCARERKRKPVYREKGRGVGGGHAQVHIARAHTHTGRGAGLRKPRGGYNAIKRPTNHGLRLKREHDLIP